MSKFAIVGDSTCDLNKEMRTKYDLDYCQMSLLYTEDGVEKEIPADIDWGYIPFKKYNDMLRAGIRFITAQVTEQEFERVIGAHLEAGEDVLYIACSSALSKSLEVAERLAKTTWKEKYPDRKVIVVDSLIACIGQGMIMIDCSNLRAEGKTIEEVAQYALDNRLNYHQYGIANTLTYLAKAGRVKAAKAFFGNLAGVKPIIISDAHGNNVSTAKGKGRRDAIDKCVAMIKAEVIDSESQTLYYEQADADPRDFEYLKEALNREGIKFKDIYSCELGPIITATCGPETIAFFVKGTPVTYVGD